MRVTSSSEATEARRSFLRRWWLTLLAIALVFGLAAIFLIFREDLVNFENCGYAGAFFIALLAGATLIVPVPGTPAIFILGGILTPWVVGPCAGLGEAIGEFTGYLAGRGGHEAVKSRNTYFYSRAEALVKRRGPLIIFAASSILNPIFDLFGFAAGALRLPSWKFFLACWGGKTVKNTGLAFLGWWGLGFILSWFGIAI
jgi:membrane protein DedA with SNARE-associated domain